MIAIRRAADADRVAIARLHEASIRALGPSHYTPAEVDSWAAGVWPARYVIEQEMYVATRGEEVIGFGHYHRGEIMAVYVDPAHIGRGAGRALIAKLEEVARADGATHLHLNAALNSIGFYAACGYAQTRETMYMTRGGLVMKCALMEKDL
ncbi:MAG TPA: GNAT family N-acetyltransferase [Thermoanaerobaculia bacterium]|nr:GNAT family N-acetyltransferase [Thermoanaerobaculia bacterium]